MDDPRIKALSQRIEDLEFALQLNPTGALAPALTTEIERLKKRLNELRDHEHG
jgi:hypothetical protein